MIGLSARAVAASFIFLFLITIPRILRNMNADWVPSVMMEPWWIFIFSAISVWLILSLWFKKWWGIIASMVIAIILAIIVGLYWTV